MRVDLSHKERRSVWHLFGIKELNHDILNPIKSNPKRGPRCSADHGERHSDVLGTRSSTMSWELIIVCSHAEGGLTTACFTLP